MARIASHLARSQLRRRLGQEPLFPSARSNILSGLSVVTTLSPINSRVVCWTAQRKNSFTFDSTVDQEARLGLSVMVTFTVPPSILYLPLTPFPEKLPEVVSPLKVASFSFATFLASDTSVLGFFVALMLKVRPPPSPPPLAVEELEVFRPLEGDLVRPTDLRGRRLGPLLCRLFVILPPPDRDSDGQIAGACSLTDLFG